jgi:protein TonB
MKTERSTLARLLATAGLFAILMVLGGASQAAAQSADGIYTPGELTSLPKVSSPAKLKSLIEQSYPSELRGKGVGGRVQVQFVVGADGKVEPGSIKVVAATAPSLVEAATAVAAKIEFTPGMKDGKPVRTQVLLPIVYAPN